MRPGDPRHERRGERHHGRPARGRARRQLGRATLLVVLSLVVVLGAGAYAAYDGGLLDRLLGPDEVAPAAIPPPEGVQLPPAAPARQVLDRADLASIPTPRRLRSHLADTVRDDDFGRHLGVLVQPLGSRRDLLRVGGDDAFVPASSMKLLTATTALQLMGPEHRFDTTVVRGKNRRSVVLVGGGDPLLTQKPVADAYPEPATLRDLARQTAQRLQADGVSRIRLSYDDSLFSGPAVSPEWERDYISGDVVSPISALWVDEGREQPLLASRSDDPAKAAAEAFADELERADIAVRGAPTAETATARSTELARVQSPTLAQIVEYVIENSDNEGAEVLLRQAGLAGGHRGSFEGGAAVVRATLSRLGVDLSKVTMYDGSGLSRQDRVSLDTLVGTLQAAASPSNPDTRPVVAGLPVAGFNGSLAYRYVTFGSEGRGLVRAKTGTLSNVNALVGVTVDRDGAPLVFAAVADHVRLIDTLDARAGLDALTADIATCC